MKQFLHIFSYHHEDTNLYKLEQKHIYKRENTEARYFLDSKKHYIAESSFGEAIIDVFYSSENFDQLKTHLSENLPYLKNVRLVNYSIGFLPKCGFNDLSRLFRSLKLSANLKNPEAVYILTRTEDKWYFGKKVEGCPKTWAVHRSKPENTSSAIPHILARSVLLFMKNLGAKSLIDYCCGSGTFTLEAASIGLKTTALDLNPNMIELTKRNIEHFGYSADILNINAATSSIKADAGVVDFPYGYHCERDIEEELSIIKTSIKNTKWVCLIHGEDITNQINKHGGKVFEKIIIPARSVKRHIHFVKAKDV